MKPWDEKPVRQAHPKHECTEPEWVVFERERKREVLRYRTNLFLTFALIVGLIALLTYILFNVNA